MTNFDIKMVDLRKQYLRIKDEIDRAIHDVIDSTQFIMGDEVGKFERNVAAYLGCKYAVGCASGTDALQVALMALDVKPGDEVITTPFTFVATTETIALLGAVPVYVDIDEKTFNIDANKIESKITPRTRFIMPVHLYGQPAEMNKIMEIAHEYRLKVIEDAAQAFGAEINSRKVCSFGDVSAISFFPSKNLGAFGDAGMVVTDNEELAQKMKMITVHGSRKKYYHERLGVNSRLDTIQAAVLNVKLKYIDTFHEARISAARKYNEKLKEKVKIPYVMPNVKHIFHQYSIRVNKRDGLQSFLKNSGVPSMIYYPVPLHLQEAYRYNYEKGDFPVTEMISREIISLPMHTELEDGEINYISDKIIEYISSF
jgi:dTDP-4-amino-4,6-dideoxygalactose transaminase